MGKEQCILAVYFVLHKDYSVLLFTNSVRFFDVTQACVRTEGL